MGDAAGRAGEGEGDDPVVHGLLVCRDARAAEDGGLDLRGVLELAVLDGLPGDAGPLTFVALLRPTRAGRHPCAFVVRPGGDARREAARYALETVVPPGYEGRQVVVRLHLPSLPVERGGVFDLWFEWAGRPLAVNRFAIGARGGPGETRAGA